MHPISTNVFYVRTVLLCSIEIESLNYQARYSIIFSPICSNCGMNNKFLDKTVISQETDDKKPIPLCIKCHAEGKKLVILGRK